MALSSYIPVDKTHLPEQFQIDIGGQLFGIRIDYNKSQGFFTIDLLSSNLTPIILGEQIVANEYLWADFTDAHLPTLKVLPLDKSNLDNPITFDNFGVSVQLYIEDGLEG